MRRRVRVGCYASLDEGRKPVWGSRSAKPINNTRFHSLLYAGTKTVPVFVICSKQYSTQPPLKSLYREILWDFLHSSLLVPNVFNVFNLILWTTDAAGVYLFNFFLAFYWSAGYFLLVTSLRFLLFGGLKIISQSTGRNFKYTPVV